MRFPLFALTFLAAQFSAALLLAQPAVHTTVNPKTLSDMELVGPYTHDNLSVFLVVDKNAAMDDEDVLTLDEALSKKVVTLKETGDVNELRITNRGKKKVFLQSGDIVKGGRQDRVLQHDTMLLPNSRDVPLSAFCVEAGRWQGRGNESTQQFSSSKNSLVTKEQKLAVKVSGNQSQVWSSVAKAQADMSRSMGRPVASQVSATSLQLTLENKKVQENVSAYVRGVEGQMPSRSDVVGYAVAVNGKMSSVDVFATPKLFNKLRQKLLLAGATEAVAAKTGVPTKPPPASAVHELLSDTESAPEVAEKSTLRTKVSRKETPKSVVFSTSDDSFRGKPAHRSYMSK